MLAIAVKKSVDDSICDDPDWSMKSIVKTGGMHIGVTTEAPYGFEFRDGRFLIVGESMCRPDNVQLRDIGIKLLRDIGDCYIPPSFVLSIIALDLLSTELVVLSGPGCRRPLYYRFDRDMIAISSHVRQIARAFGPLALNDSAFAELIVYRYITPPATVFANILEMVGGQRIRLKIQTLPECSKSTWRLDPKAVAQQDVEPNAHCRSLLGRSISDELVGFANPATLFSGGLDSSLVAAINRSFRPEAPLFSSSFSFLDPDELETTYSITAAKSLELPLHIHKGTPEDYLRGMVASVLHAEEPLHHLQSVMLHQVFNDPRVRRHGVLLSGEAADSLFGNNAAQDYLRRRSVLNVLDAPVIPGAVKIAFRALGKADPRFNYYAHDFSKNHEIDSNILWTLGKYSSADIAKEVFGYGVDRIMENKRQLLDDYKDAELLDKINILSLRSAAFKSMTIWSKLAEGAGIAIHYPFTDTNLVSYVMSLPWKQKCAEPKMLIRGMLRMEGVPESIVSRPKLGFGVPTKYWALRNTLFQPIVDMAGDYFGRNTLGQLQVEEQTRAMALWSALNLYLIKSLFIDGQDADALAGEIVDRYRTANSNL